VGVKAPGRPTMIVFLPAVRATMSTFSGGKPKSTETAGILSPTAFVMADERKARDALGIAERNAEATPSIMDKRRTVLLNIA